MSCEIVNIASVDELNLVKNFLFPEQLFPKDDDDENVWDIDWEYDEDRPKEFDSWLEDCLISVSPMCDSVALARQNRIMLLSAKWDELESKDVKTKFCILWKEELVFEDFEFITSIICLPLASHKRSSHGGPDWTAVILGFNSGCIRAYTESGALLLSQHLHLQPVMKLKCQTASSAQNPSQAALIDEFMILYPSVVVMIDGFSLFQALRACRSQLARATASGSDIIQPPPLAYKKWEFTDQEKTTDFDCLGTVVNNLYDHLQSTSLISGFHATPNVTPTTSSLFVTTGLKPYVSFFYTSEGETTPIVSEIAIAVASNLKNVLFNAASGLLGFAGKSTQEDAKSAPKIESAKKLSMRFSLLDHRRGDSIVISPSRNLAAITDNYGRVVLMDIIQGIAVRMWKGYRDAQCAWIVAHEDRNKNDEAQQRRHLRTSLFLIIYAPRRGILEVWTAQNGPRVAAFNVKKYSRLIYSGYHMMGLNWASKSRSSHPSCHCFFMEPDGIVKSIEIPFHLALNDKSSKRARDLHLFKKLKNLLRNGDFDEDDKIIAIKNIFIDMKIASIRQQSLSRIINSTCVNLKLLEIVIDEYRTYFQKQDIEEIDLESKLLVQQCSRLSQLLKLYQKCVAMNETAGIEANDKSSVKAVLKLSDKEFVQVEELVDMHKKIVMSSQSTVKFQREIPSVSKFLAHFKHFDGHLEHGMAQGSCLSIRISEDDNNYELAEFIFKSVLHNCQLKMDLCDALIQNGISLQDLSVLLVSYWLDDDVMSMDWSMVISFHSIMEIFLAECEKTKIHLETCEIISHKISSSNNIIAAYTICLVINSLIPSLNYSDEVLSQWTLLKLNLSDTLALSSLLKFEPKSSKENSSFSFPISLDTLILKGRGCVSEFISRWMVQNNFSPETIWCLSHLQKPEFEIGMDEEELKILLDLLKQVRLYFPSSTDYDTLLANVCWENAVRWNEDSSSTDRMNAVPETLKYIASSLLRHGIASMLWRMFLYKKFCTTAILIEKIGRIPKDRLCSKNIGINHTAIEGFVSFCHDVLNLLLESNEPLGMEAMPISDVDRLWNQNYQGPAPLTEMALTEKPTNQVMVNYHYQLATAVYMIVFFNQKKLKPISLFSKDIVKIFFKPLDLAINVRNFNEDLVSTKIEFLSRIVTAIVRMFLECGVPQNIDKSTSMPTPSAEDQSKATHWINKVYELADVWEIDVDELKSVLICELYSSGLDQQAERTLKSLSNSDIVVPKLLEILGMRLNHVIISSADPTKKLCTITPSLHSWIKSSDSSMLRCNNPSKESTLNLLVQIVNISSESSSEYRRCMAVNQVFESIYEIE